MQFERVLSAVDKRLSLAYREMREINPKLSEKFGLFITELDLSNNNLRCAILFFVLRSWHFAFRAFLPWRFLCALRCVLS